MNEIVEYCEKWKKTLVIFVIIFSVIVFYILTVFSDWLFIKIDILIDALKIQELDNVKQLTHIVVSFLLTFVGPVGLGFVMYRVFSNYIQTKAWKKKYPQYDIDGEWKDETRYHSSLFSNAGSPGVPPAGEAGNGEITMIESSVIFEQTWNSITVVPSTGNKFTWKSVLAGWKEKGSIEILYEVKYYNELQVEASYPEIRYGRESMSIDKYDGTTKKPIKMTGQYWHCVSSDGKPCYMGDVTYTRVINK